MGFYGGLKGIAIDKESLEIDSWILEYLLGGYL